MDSHATFVSGVPRPQGSMTLARDPRTGREFAKYSGPTVEWRRACYVQLSQWWGGGEPLRGALWARYSFVMPRPRTHFSARGGLKVSAPHWHVGRTGDLDKLVRAVGDALTDAGVWEDDGFVALMRAEKVLAGDGERTGVRIEIGVLEAGLQ